MNRHLTHYFTVNTPGMIQGKLDEWLSENQHLQVVSVSHNVYQSSNGETVVSVLVVSIPGEEDEEDGISGDEGGADDGDGE